MKSFTKISFVATLLIVGALATPLHPSSKSNKIVWMPNDDGKIVPAIIHQNGLEPRSKAVESDVHFYLLTHNNPNDRQNLIVDCLSCLEATNFVRNAPIKILFHGFSSSADSGSATGLKNEYLQHMSGPLNVILVNWQALAVAPWYETAARNTRIVGTVTGRLIDFLIREGYTRLDLIHAIGHSLGAHAAAFSSNNAGGNGRFARLTGIDPALPLFGVEPESGRFDPSDADFVDVVHTAGGTLWDGGLAFTDPIGDIDFYPNSGLPPQPGCGSDIVGSCSHGRAYAFFGESISNRNGFNGCQCTDWTEYTSGNCACNVRASLGEHVSTSARGLFFLRTNASPPYAQN